jgi:peptide deformylase
MAVYQVVVVPNEVLRAKAVAVNKVNAGVLRVLDNMRDTMYAFDGVGLAAPQIGVSRRIIVVDTGDSLYELINPELIYLEGEQTGKEGCLSVPDVVGIVKRAQKVKVKGLDRNGQEQIIEASDLAARAFQHEIDHLDGILFTDKAIETRRVNG